MTIRKAYNTGGEDMELQDQIIALRKETKMGRREFAEYFGIPYRTLQDWELGNRKMPEYLYRLMAYKVEMEKIGQAKEKGEGENGQILC